MKPLTSSVLVLGSTGLIGREVIRQSPVPLYCAARRSIDDLEPKHQLLVENNLTELQFPDGLETVICCLGSTIKKAGSKQAFKAMDLDLPLGLLEKALEQGAKRLLIVSSQGASSKSLLFYNQIKGNLEDAIGLQNWQQVVIFRPSLLLGQRDEMRPVERFAQWLFPLIGFLLPIRYRPIDAHSLSSAIWHYCNNTIEPGIQVKEGKQLWIK